MLRPYFKEQEDLSICNGSGFGLRNSHVTLRVAQVRVFIVPHKRVDFRLSFSLVFCNDSTIKSPRTLFSGRHSMMVVK
jgi:hypothetical protein